MCGIVGIYLKNKKLKNKLGLYMSKMIDNMSSRGPDSAGFAIYNEEKSTCYKYSICFGFMNFSESVGSYIGFFLFFIRINRIYGIYLYLKKNESSKI